MTTFSCLRRPSWILAAILGKKMLQKYSHNSSIIPTDFELSNFKTKKKSANSHILLRHLEGINFFKDLNKNCDMMFLFLKTFHGLHIFKDFKDPWGPENYLHFSHAHIIMFTKCFSNINEFVFSFIHYQGIGRHQLTNLT